MQGLIRQNQFSNTKHDKLTLRTQIIIDGMEEKIKDMRLDFHDRVSMIHDDFSKAQINLENAIIDIKVNMKDAIAKKTVSLEEEYEMHMNKMTCDIAENID